MKKYYLFALLISFLSFQSFSFVSSTSETEKAAVTPPETETTAASPFAAMTVDDIMSLTPKKYMEMTGHKMNLKDRVALKFIQHGIKRDLKKHGKVDLNSYLQDDWTFRFNIGGFLLGLFLGLIGVALAHIFSRDKSFRRSAWWGVGVLLIVGVIIAIAGGGE